MLKRLLKYLVPKIKIIKLAKILRINPKFFFDLTLYHFSKLIRGKVDDNLVILGSASGKAFIGNPKYLYFYLKENTNYKIFYFVKSKNLLKELKSKGINAIFAYSVDAIKLLRKARAIFVSHGYSDVLPFKKSPRTVFIQMWHGGDIKLIDRYPYFDKYIDSYKARLLRLKLKNKYLYNFVLNTSAEKKPLQILSNAFKIPIEKILPIGYPRNDFFFLRSSDLEIRLKEFFQIPKNTNKILLYAPTYREFFTSKDPFTNEDLIELNKYCKENNSILLIKAHISEKSINLRNFGNIKVVEKDSDIQELLYITDVLITDYSSVYFDFMLLNRPIILYTYDYNEYIEKRGIYYNHMEDISPGPLVYDVKALIDALKNIIEIQESYKSKYVKLKSYFNRFDDGESSKRLLRFLKLI